MDFRAPPEWAAMPDDDTPHNSGSKWSMDYEAMGGTVSTAVIDIYPGYEGEFSIGGWVTVADLGEQQGCIDCTGPTGGLVLKAGLFGLESSAIGGLHVHAHLLAVGEGGAQLLLLLLHEGRVQPSN